MLNVCKAFLPYLRATTGHRTISNFGSIASWSGGAGYALYCGTKWACSDISEAMHAELAPKGRLGGNFVDAFARAGMLVAVVNGMGGLGGVMVCAMVRVGL